MSEHVTIFEVGPRDGLQNESTNIPTKDKIELINRLSRCGFEKIEVASFVSPKWVPEMADSGEVAKSIERRNGTSYAGLTPNVRGYHAAIDAKVDEVAVFASATEGFSQKNANCSVEECFERVASIFELARKDNMPVRGYVSCIIRCPYDGDVDPAAVLDRCEKLLNMGCYEVSLGDTIGAGTPQSTAKLLDTLCMKIEPKRLAGHYHDTNSKAIENIAVSLDYGLRTFDSAVGGLGGCPYAPGAKGNVATESVLALMEKRGFETGIDTKLLNEANEFLFSRVGLERQHD